MNNTAALSRHFQVAGMLCSPVAARVERSGRAVPGAAIAVAVANALRLNRALLDAPA